MINRRGSLQNELHAVRIAIIDAERDILQWNAQRQRSSLAGLNCASRTRHLEARLTALHQRRAALIARITAGDDDSFPKVPPPAPMQDKPHRIA